MLKCFAEDEALALYNELFSDTSLEVGKTLSKGERDEKNLNHEKVSSAVFATYIYNCLAVSMPLKHCPVTKASEYQNKKFFCRTNVVADIWGGRISVLLQSFEKN